MNERRQAGTRGNEHEQVGMSTNGRVNEHGHPQRAGTSRDEHARVSDKNHNDERDEGNKVGGDEDNEGDDDDDHARGGDNQDDEGGKGDKSDGTTTRMVTYHHSPS